MLRNFSFCHHIVYQINVSTKSLNSTENEEPVIKRQEIKIDIIQVSREKCWLDDGQQRIFPCCKTAYSQLAWDFKFLFLGVSLSEGLLFFWNACHLSRQVSRQVYRSSCDVRFQELSIATSLKPGWNALFALFRLIKVANFHFNQCFQELLYSLLVVRFYKRENQGKLLFL